jgi:hypothetical protein
MKSSSTKTKQKEAHERSADGEPVKSFLVRLPESLSNKLDKAHYEQKRPKAEIVRDALTLYLRD